MFHKSHSNLDNSINVFMIFKFVLHYFNLRYLGRVDEADSTDWELHPFSSPPDPRDWQ